MISQDRKCIECDMSYVAYAWNSKYCSKKCLYRVKRRSVKSKPSYEMMARRSNLRQKFGMTLEDYDLMLQNQNFRCAICNIHHSELSRRMAVDHDHQTGRIRGLLCIECNRGIGALKDSVYLLEKAHEYLERNRI